MSKHKKREGEVRFVLKKQEVALLREELSDFSREFSSKKLTGDYEFTYSYKALNFLAFRIAAVQCFMIEKNQKAKWERLFQKIDSLCKLSDAFRAEVNR